MDLTNDDVADILALLDSLPYDELDLQTPRFRLTLRRTPDGWTQGTQVLSAPDPIAAPARRVTTPMSHRRGQDHRDVTSALLGGRPEVAGGATDGTEETDGVGVGRAEGEAGKAGLEAGKTGLEAGETGLVAVRAPLPGTFYRAPRPGAAPFVEVGSRVDADRAHPDVMRLVYERLVAAGISRFVVLDPTHDMDAALTSARMIRRAGGTEIIMALTYTISAVHDDAFYAAIAGLAAASPYIDRAYLKDPAGLLTPERARTLIPAVRARLAGKPLELHSHCTIGLSPLVYLTAPGLGVSVLQVACGALADGTSLPDAERVVANVRALGHAVDVDDRLLARAARYFSRLAAAESLPAGRPQPYDEAFTRHQLAGGVMTTLRRQLGELGLRDRFGAVIEEVSRVRAELGYPIMVTPFPQMVMGQALSNVLADSRYDVVPDQVIRYVLGSFGKPTGPVEPRVLDRILDRPRARELAAEPPPLPVAELRRRLPRGISNEELLLRFGMPAGEVDAMLAAGPAARHYTPEVQPVLRLLRELGARPPVASLVVDKPGFRLSLSKDAADA